MRVLSNPAYPGSRTTVEDAAARPRNILLRTRACFLAGFSKCAEDQPLSMETRAWKSPADLMFICSHSR